MPDVSSYAVFLTAAGWAGIQVSTVGIQRVILPRASANEVRGMFEGVVENQDTGNDLQKRLGEYFSGKYTEFPDYLDLSWATAFQRRVWEATRAIPYGQTQSYRWLAEKINQPGAARAVGQALGKNPVPVIVPCHRVLASGGVLGGFTGGLDMKKYLLGLEKIGTIY